MKGSPRWSTARRCRCWCSTEAWACRIHPAQNKIVLALHRESSSSLPWALVKLRISRHCHLDRHPKISSQPTQQGVIQAETTCTQPEGLVAATQHAPCHHWAHGTKVVASPCTWDFPTNAAGYFKCLNISLALCTRALCPTSAKKQSWGKQVVATKPQTEEGEGAFSRPPLVGWVSEQLWGGAPCTSKLFCRQTWARAKQIRSSMCTYLGTFPGVFLAFKLVTTKQHPTGYGNNFPAIVPRDLNLMGAIMTYNVQA